jgi:hypothetical protein
MDIVQLLEQEAPILSTNTEKIVVNVSKATHGQLYLKNIGKGTLKGAISCNNTNVTFKEEEFEGNNIKVVYKIDVSKYNVGQVIKTSATIISNGGEISIPIIIQVNAPSIETEDAIITDLKDFLQYAKKNYKQAQLLFNRNEFVSWLTYTEYPYLPIYDQISKDINKERALENFFILNKLKSRVKLKSKDQDITFSINHDSKETIQGEIIIKKSCWGYIKEEIKSKNNSNWLSFNDTEVTANNFEDDVYLLKYSINTSLIQSNITTDEIIIGEDIKVPIQVRRKKIAYFNLSKESFNFEDTGFIKIENHSNRDIKVEVSTKDSFLKFDAKNYYVNKTKEIPFSIKFTALQIAQTNIKKHPLVESEIYFKIIYSNKKYMKTLKITIGEV